MGEFQPMTSFERDITFGPKVETSVEQRIKDTAEKISRDKILEPDSFASEPDRNLKANEVIESLGFSSYIDMVDAMVDPNRPAVQEKAKTSFDILARSMALAMNYGGSPELQTRVNLGSTTITEVEPFYWQYVNSGKPDVVLAERVMEVSVTNKDILDRAKKIDKLRRRIDFSNEVEKKSWIGILEKEVTEVLNMDIGDDKEHELLGFKAYLSTEVAVLKGEFNSRDGSVDGIDEDVINPGSRRERTNRTESSGDSSSSVDYEPPVYNPETREWEGGSKWELSPEYTAEAMKYMDYSMRWQSYTPPEWFKDLDPTLQAKIEYMVMVNSAAAGLLHAGKDLEKILGNDGAFVFTNEQMTRLFDDDFKLVTSKILNDLCEFYTDKNGIKSLRYKERFYQLDKESEDGFAHGADGRRIEIPYTIENRGKGIRTIDQDVLRRIETIMDYKDEVALWLAEYKQALADERGVPVEKGVWATYSKDKDGHRKGEFILDKDGKKVPGYRCKMDANTAYNLMYAMGDMSVWDRMRILPTYNGVIADAIRTLNPEYKALGKWMVIKSGRIKDKESLFDSEYFSGNLADYYLEVDKLERDLGGPIDGKKTIRQKVVDGELSLLSSKTFYGFFDFVNTGRDLYDANGDNNLWNRNTKAGVQKSLGELVMEYAFGPDGKVLPKSQRRDFSFGHKSVSFMNEFRDSMEGAILAYNCATGKTRDAENPAVWARNLKDKMGMVNGIEFFGRKVFSYNRNPSFWRDAIVGSFGYDNRRLSSDHPYLLRKSGKEGDYAPYSKHVYRLLVDTFKLSNTDVDINEVMRLLGVDIKEGEYPNSVPVTLRNNEIERREIQKTENLKIKRRKESKFDSHTAKKFDLPSLVSEIRGLRTYTGYEEFDRMKRDFETLVKAGKGFDDNILVLADAIKSFKP